MITAMIPPKTLGRVYDYMLQWQQSNHKPYGLYKDSVPKTYIEKTFQKSLSLSLAEIFLSCNTYNELILGLRKAQSLIHITFEPTISLNIANRELSYFIPTVNTAVSCELKNTPKKIKYPLRKKYRDLDKQALLIENEYKNKSDQDVVIDNGDWIKFKVTILAKNIIEDSINPSSLIPTSGVFWLKISPEPTDINFYQLFAGKKKNDTFTTTSKALNAFIQPSHLCNFTLEVTILEHVSVKFFCFDKFKNFFSCRSQEDLLTRIIDVLSLRQEIPLRTEITQMVMKSLLDCYKVSLPEDILAIFEKDIHETIVYNPDYIIYQAQSNFEKTVKSIAYKTAIETTLIDFLIVEEKIPLLENDVYLFFNILQRPRLHYFHHFNNSFLRRRTKELPIPEELINQYVLREKTIQYFVKTLSK